MGFVNGWLGGVAEARPQAIGELAPANWGGGLPVLGIIIRIM